jgi:hypothetical protein
MATLFTQSKTGALLEVPAHRALRAIIDTMPKCSTIMVTGARGRPFTGAGFRARIFKLIRKLETDKVVGMHEAQAVKFHRLIADSSTQVRQSF